MKTRIYFLDNLRTFLIFLVVLLHCGIVYEAILENTWIVVDPIKNNAIGLVRMYLDIFVMFTLFFIAGYFIPNSLKIKSTLSFIKSKFNRILLPWIVAVFTLIPAYKVIFLFSRGLPQEEWFSYFHIFQRAGGNPYFFADNPVQNWLWFLPVLFGFQIMYLVLARTKLLNLKISVKTGVILTIVIGLVYSMAISSMNLTGWYHSAIFHFQRERLLIYFMVFLLGSLCYKHRVFESEIKNKRFYIWTNVILSVSISIFTVVALNLFFNLVDPERNYFFVSSIIDRTVYYAAMLLTMFSFLYILLYAFRFSLNKTGRLLEQLSNNSYYVYIIHVIVLGLIALPLLHINLPAFVKFILLTILTFIISNIMVSAYLSVFKKSFSSKIATVGVVIAGILLTFSIYAGQISSANSIKSAATKSSILPPDVELHMAVITGNMEAVGLHISAGSDVDKKESQGGSSPLITAAVFGKTEVALALIKAGADVNFENNEGSTPLHSAAFFCRTEIVEALLANGANKNIKNKAGSTALETVSGPFEPVAGIYDYFANALGPMGLNLDYEQIKKGRPEIAEMLR
jgi:fucose 4-O-acetylase-like acetyltransferase